MGVLHKSMLCCPFDAEHVIWIAAFHLHLNGCMGDTKIVLELLRHRAENVFSTSHTLFIHHDVATTTNHPGTNRPHVQVMDCQYAMHVGDRSFNPCHIYALGNSLQQHIDRFL